VESIKAACEPKSTRICDGGWNAACEVIDGIAPSLVLNRDELEWLKAC
jgi:hypothetical protein